MKTKILYLSLFTALSLVACKKFIETPIPPNLVSTSKVFEDVQSATAAQVGIYQKLSAYTPYKVTRHLGAYADELTNFDNLATFSLPCYTNNLTPVLEYALWSDFYTVIYQTNLVIENLAKSNLNQAATNQLTGESKFSRAFFYFNLVNIFGEVPLTLGTDYRQNTTLERSSIEKVYNQIIADLEDAEILLPPEYVNQNNIAQVSQYDNRIRPNQYAAKALLARVHLFRGNFDKALRYAGDIVKETNLYDFSEDLNTVFNKLDNKEVIWQLEYNNNNVYWGQGAGYIPYSWSPVIGANYENQSSALSPSLVNAFEENDKRKETWLINAVDPSGNPLKVPFKYKESYSQAPFQNETVLRVAEQYLILAEAKAQTGDLDGAKAALDAVRTRGNNLSGYNGSLDKQSLLDAILHERQVELFTEWGHRFFDLKRTGKLDDVMKIVAPQKGGSWSSFKQVWPIPETERQLNNKLGQNQGY